ncbi:chemotaxis protein CheW [Geomonas sp. Red32]|uniref:chemotaxis protein CheW n=1 Tax=Geomonas sp. Red32 TaxID=2912856 RepID=UPI00202D0236|nr:chemotaxis protein CheW [Geomonas sp. Red32]MCM0083768.1 chemotaxis protein CheW [Geomonas sp. Red32]
MDAERDMTASEEQSGEIPGGLDPAREREILLARAHRLAARPEREEDAGPKFDCLEFRLSGESWGVELSFVKETLAVTDFTPLFCTPPFVLGIVQVRGRIVSIVDLRRFLEIPAPGLSDLNRVIVVGDGTVEFGILADAVVGVRTLSRGALQPPPITLSGTGGEFLAGVTAGRLAVLDLARVLADPRLVVHEEVS